MSKEDEKDNQKNGSFSDSAQMFDTLFREAIPKEKEGKKAGQKGEGRLSDSDELLVSVFKEDAAPGKGTPRRAAAPVKDASKMVPKQQERPRKRERPDPVKDKVPAARRPGETGPPPEVRKPVPEAGKPLPQAKPSSRWNPMMLGLVGMGVLLLAGGLLVYSGLFEPSPPQRPSQPPKPLAKKEIPPPPAPPKPEVKKEAARAAPEVPSSQEKLKAPSSPVPKDKAPAEPTTKVAAGSSARTDVPPPKTVSYPYSAYLGSFRDRERLQKAVSVFQGMGLSPYWCRLDLGDKGVWFRVFAGHFRTREEGERFVREKGIQEAASRETRYAALVGTFVTKEELDRQVSRLTGLGFGPYVIRDGEAAARLYVGAFYQESHAEEQVKELASKGIESRVAER